jgi:hypothetical protein
MPQTNKIKPKSKASLAEHAEAAESKKKFLPFFAGLAHFARKLVLAFFG